jgi:RNA polymerase sigma-70 factor (ECF subfamily)
MQMTESSDDRSLVAALRARDETAFLTLVRRYHGALLHLAMSYVPSRAVAEEVVQETWLGVLRGIDRFEGRSSFKTWLFRILVNTAKTFGARERRNISFSALGDAEDGGAEPAVDPARFRPEGDQWQGGWLSFPPSWEGLPEERLLAWETRECIRRSLDDLPPAQRRVIALRDISGWTAEEVCAALAISAANQRVLLHRARSRVRGALENYLAAEASPA